MRAARGAAALLLVAAAGCGGQRGEMADVAGDAEQGRLLLRQYGCGACHRIPGVAAAGGTVGPPLAQIKDRVYLAGVLPNTPANLVRWIRDPQAVDPLTAMPNLRVPADHAQDMAAYLYRGG